MRSRVFHPTGSVLGNFLRQLLVGLLVLVLSGAAAHSASIVLWRTPGGGIQPQAVTDSAGVVHLIFFQGDPQQGDIYYCRRASHAASFTEPIRVNGHRGSAIAIGTIRGAQLALGKNGRVHVVWNGSAAEANGRHAGAPLLYTRSAADGNAFEPERDMIIQAAGLDGGSSIAADRNGNVYVAWHARTPEAAPDEEGRAVFLRRSQDDGVTFGPERPALRQDTGVCACCGMRALAGDAGSVYLAYRGASAMTNRSERLLVSRDFGKTFEIAKEDPWISAVCPMSSCFLSPDTDGALAAWETAGQVYFSSIHARASASIHPPGHAERKHPVVVQNGQGEILLAWTEGTGWAKGGALAWQLFDRAGQPLPEHGRTESIPVWSLAAGCALPDGSFVLIY